MTMRRASAAVSAVLLILVSVAIAEAALLMLFVLFSYILRLNFGIQLGDQDLQMWFPPAAEPTVQVHQAGVIGSTLVTLACGVGAAVRRYRRWKPA
jgi:hypothetical protein